MRIHYTKDKLQILEINVFRHFEDVTKYLFFYWKKVRSNKGFNS